MAITRPRRGLVVVGDPETLKKGSADWQAFFEAAGAQRWVTSAAVLPAAPWQLAGVDPFDDAVAGGAGGSSSSSWSSVGSEDGA